MRKVLIGFSKTKKKLGIFSWIIRKIECTDYSHTYLRFNNSRGKGLIYQASHTMVNFMGEKVFLEQSEPVKEYEILLTEEQYAEMIDFCIDRCGIPYAALENLGIGIARLCNVVGIKAHNIFGIKRSAYKCSEIVAEFLENILKVEIPEDLDMVSPKQVHAVVEKLYGSSK